MDGDAAAPTRPGRLPDGKLRQVTAYIDDNLAGRLRLVELGSIAHLSPFHFARLFRRATGVSPHRFVVRRRVEAAAALLTKSTSPIAAVARAVGFRSASQFATTFRRLMGLTPSAYRTSHGEAP